MFETIFESTTTASSISEKSAIISLIVAVGIGFFISLVYIYSNRDKKHSTNFAFTLVILPVVVTAVIMLVGSDIAKAFTLGGVFALVRFRSVPGDSKDIASVFFAMATGLATGMGYVSFAVIFSLGVGILYFGLVRFGYGEKKSVLKQLKITVPENLNFNGAFEDLFEEYSDGATLDRIKTTNLGTLYELTYSISLKKDINEKQFLDSIRCRNGNLNIILCQMPDKSDVL